jgi:taurine dioxygenase
MKIVPIRKSFGAEVVGFSFDAQPEPSVVAALRVALVRYGLLLFRGRTLEPALQTAFTGVLGGGVHRCSAPTRRIPEFPEIFRVSNRAEEGNLNNGRYWHSDGAYLEVPTAVTLHHIVRATEDGDTLYANLAGAYERLKPRERGMLASMRTISQVAAVSHPIVQKHPLSGRTILYVNLEPSAQIVDKDGKAHPEFVPFLRDQLNRRCYRHKWHAGDLVVVDNYATAHCATPADPRELPVLHRTTVPGQRVWWREASASAGAALPDVAEPPNTS